MRHSFMDAVASGLSDREVATLRYQFPYMEAGSKRPDRPEVAHAAVRGAIDTAKRLTPDLPLFAGGKSFGGRMTSQAQATAALPNVRGLVFFGFPLHPSGKPSIDRAKHLKDLDVPMLFIQGTRDALADFILTEEVVSSLSTPTTLHVVDDGDHSFHVRARSGRTDHQTLEAILDAVADWMRSIAVTAA